MIDGKGPELNELLDNTPGNQVLGGVCRVIAIAVDRIALIDLPKEDPKRRGRMLDYVGAPHWEDISTLKAHRQALRINVPSSRGTPGNSVPDKDMLEQAANERERSEIQARLNKRDRRYAILLHVIRKPGKELAVYNAAELLADQSLSKRIRKAAARCKCSISTIYNILHRYWAGGSVKNALFTAHANCGKPGVPKTQKNSLGRKSRLYKAGRTPHRCYRLDKDLGPDAHLEPESDKQKLAFGWRLISHGRSRQDAYDLVSAAFWADIVVNPSGRTCAVLWDEHLRPTFAQFCRWGRKLNHGRSATELILGPRKWAMKTETRGGSEQDLVVSVGQLGAFDGTKTDVYLCSSHSVLKKLPPMLRLTIKDVRTGVICGWYLGWQPASPLTACQAIYHAASSKVAEGLRLGIKITDEIIPAILHANYLADNGELKAQAITEMEEQFSFGISYTGRPDKKGGIETQHHTDHSRLDHKLPGSTGGKMRARGEDHAALGGLYNSYEYRREYVFHVIENNNEEVPHLCPPEMQILNPELRPTRINLFHWLRRHQSSELPRDVEALRAYGLPDVEAVIRKNGVYPLINVLGTKVVIPRFRFSSPELIATGLMNQVARTGKTLRVRLKLDESNPQEAYLATKAGLIPLQCATRRASIMNKLTMSDWVASEEDRLLARDENRGARQQERVDTQVRRGDTEIAARQRLATEIGVAGKKPSKAETLRDMDKNLEEEMALEIAAQRDGAVPTKPYASAPATDLALPPASPAVRLASDSINNNAVPDRRARLAAAALAMANLNDEEDD